MISEYDSQICLINVDDVEYSIIFRFVDRFRHVKSYNKRRRHICNGTLRDRLCPLKMMRMELYHTKNVESIMQRIRNRLRDIGLHQQENNNNRESREDFFINKSRLGRYTSMYR